MHNKNTSKYNTLNNVTLNNKMTGDTLTGNVVNEDEIDGRKFWVFYPKERPQHRMLLSKEHYIVKKNKS